MSDLGPIIIDDPQSDHITSTDPQRFSCETCGTPLSYGGRGRHPKFCDDHKPGASKGTTPRKSRGVANIEQSMTQLYELAGQAITLGGGIVGDEALKVDGELIEDRADVLAAEWAKLAANDPKVRKALEGLSTGSAWGGVVITHAMLAFAMVRNHQVNAKPKVPKPPKRGRPQPQPQPAMRPEPGPFIEPESPAAFNGNGPPIHVPEQLYES